jgi:hypothetical protein
MEGSMPLLVTIRLAAADDVNLRMDERENETGFVDFNSWKLRCRLGISTVIVKE